MEHHFKRGTPILNIQITEKNRTEKERLSIRKFAVHNMEVVFHFSTADPETGSPRAEAETNET